MNIIQNPYHIYTPDDAEYVETRNEDGELVNYHAPAEGFFVIHHKPVPELSGMEFDTSAENLVSTGNSGAPTYTYRLESRADYEAIFPPVVEDMPEPAPTKPAPYDLDAGKAQARSVLHNHYNTRQKALASKYPERESLTWSTQLEESLRYLDGKGSVFIERVAEQTGQTATEYAELIISNNALYQQALADLTAMRMLTDDAIDSAQTQQDISDIIGGMING